jgi:DNA-binding XRE family transcriptional regulator
MAGLKLTGEEKRERRERSDEWRRFRRDHLFTQKKLGEIIGVSRRTIQEIEAARISPHAETLRVFAVFKRQYEANVEYSEEKLHV